jgi:hypothetical protein
MGARRPLVLLAAVALCLGASKDPSAPGAYCPLPKAGEKPSCLAGAEQTYQGFFLGLEQGTLDEAEAARIEQDLKGARPEKRFEALSTLSYGYFMLARKAAAGSSQPNPTVVARLERWNRLLGEAYAESEEDPHYRAAVREAAVDLRRNVPALGLRCTDAEGHTARCDSTEAVIRAMDERRQETGLRGALARLIDAIFPGEEQAR